MGDNNAAVNASQTRDPAPPDEHTFLTVALGASAGGLAPLKGFFQAMPPDSGMAFVVIQHLDPKRESIMVSLLQHHTTMPVVLVTEGMVLEPNRVHMIPPGQTMTIADSTLHLRAPEERRGMRLPINAFFVSLAEAQNRRAVGIVLSGTASDGTEGLREIRAKGGLAIAQSPEQAEHEWMPRNAVAAGVVDLILNVDEMPPALLNYQRHPYLEKGEAAVEQSNDEVLRSILQIINARLGHDFQGYRKSTLLRRIGRRMGFRSITSMGDYERYLRENPEEVSALFSDMLIGVTRFFREPEAWEALEKLVVRPLVERPDNAPIRVWVTGCSNGKEAYSVAILFFAVSEELARPIDLQIFATDVDTEALAVARAGRYSLDIEAEVPQEYLGKYFVGDETSFRVVQKVRQAIVFAPHNSLSDPPFSRMDLITCRNLLIYLEPEVQERLLGVFHFALNPGGCLFLGSSESVGAQKNSFETLSKKWRILRRGARGAEEPLSLPLPPYRGHQKAQTELATGQLHPETEAGLPQLVEGLVLDQLGPACLVVDPNDNILYYLGGVDVFLRQPRRAPSDNLFARLHEGLRTSVRALLRQARASGTREASLVVPELSGQRTAIEIEAIPLRGAQRQDLLLVVLRENKCPTLKQLPSGTGEPATLVLEQELASERANTQNVVEELESSNEELTASNEEMASMNEEVQAANEELETSREELQSVNEELRTVNAELADKLDQLEHSNDDRENLLRSTNIPTIFLDQKLRLRLFTPAALRLFNFLPLDVGRPVTDLAPKLQQVDLPTDARQVLATLEAVSHQIQTADGRRYIQSTQPYRTQDQTVGGVVVTFVDVTDLEQTRAELRDEQSRSRMAVAVEASQDAIFTVDQSGLVLTWNAGAARLYGWQPEDIVGKPYLQLVPPDQMAATAAALEHAQAGDAVTISDTTRRRHDGGVVPISAIYSPVLDKQGQVLEVSVIERDISETKRAEAVIAERNAQVAKSESQYRELVQTANSAIIRWHRSGRIEFVNEYAETLFGYEPGELLGKPIGTLVPEVDEAGRDLTGLVDAIVADPAAFRSTENENVTKDGRRLWLLWSARALLDEQGNLESILAIATDRTAQHQAEQELEANQRRLRALAAELSTAEHRERQRLATIIHDGVAQTLGGLKMRLQHLRMQPEAAPVVAELSDAISVTDEAVQESRSVISELNPPMLSQFGLTETLRWWGSQLHQKHGLEVSVNKECDLAQVEKETQVTLFQIVKELLRNTVKHAQATRATITVRGTESGFEIEVVDDGVGFDPNSDEYRGQNRFGLFNTRERIGYLGGELQVDSAPGRGTRVTISLSLPRTESTG